MRASVERGMKTLGYRKITYFCLVASLFGWRLFSAEPFIGQSLQEYLQRGLEANPGLQVAERQYRAALEKVPQAASLPDPMVQVTYFVEEIQTRTGPQDNVWALNQRFPWFGTLDGREKAAAAAAEALWYGYQQQQLNLIRDLSQAFYEYTYTREAIERTTLHLNLLKEWEPVVETRVKTGGSLNELLRLKVEIGKLQDVLQSLGQNRISQSARLKEMLAINEIALLPWPDEERVSGSENVDLEHFTEQLSLRNPELLGLQSQIARTEALQKVARLQSYPDFVLGANYIQIGDPVTATVPADGGEDAWGVTAAISIPLQFGRNKAAREEAAFAGEAATRAYEQRLNVLRADVQATMAKLSDAQRRIKLYGNDLLPLADQALENTRTAYEGARASLLELIDSERSQLDLQLLYERAVTDAAQQYIKLKTLLNTPPINYETEK